MAHYFVRFAKEEERSLVTASLGPTASEFDQPYESRRDSHLLIADLGPEEAESARESGAQVYEDVQFAELVQNPLWLSRGTKWAYWEQQPTVTAPAAPPWANLSQTDVMNHINAPAAWKHTRGQGVTIAIVDTGISGSMSEFPNNKRSPQSVTFAFADPWTDVRGHGSMCASAAAATSAYGGKYDGVAPDATLLSARTTLFSTDIYKIYDQLTDDRLNGLIGPLVISNSYGLYRCTPPQVLPEDHPYLGIVREAVENGIVVVFAAGNNHVDVCSNDPRSCRPNSIWAVNSIDEVLTVGTVNASDSNYAGEHANSSRGPGQWAKKRGKPDVVAPTYGEIVWGSGYSVMEWWGTSGACPQVAGLTALILSVNPNLSPDDVGDVIRSTAVPLEAPAECVGAGRIDCEAAVLKASIAGGKQRGG